MNRREFFRLTKAIATAALTLVVCVFAFAQSAPPSAPAEQINSSAQKQNRIQEIRKGVPFGCAQGKPFDFAQDKQQAAPLQ
ncbi:MAG TPA: hypothetical protein VIH72_10370 [Candidatus Acidoferrales bacterium]